MDELIRVDCDIEVIRLLSPLTNAVEMISALVQVASQVEVARIVRESTVDIKRVAISVLLLEDDSEW